MFVIRSLEHIYQLTMKCDVSVILFIDALFFLVIQDAQITVMFAHGVSQRTPLCVM